MSSLNPNKLHVTYLKGVSKRDPINPRAYTLTHSDLTGDLYLTIGPKYNKKQISGFYTRLMRDEVLANWIIRGEPSLMVHCHVSGGLVIGSPRWRYSIFKRHLPMVIQAFRFGDRSLFIRYPKLDSSNVLVQFHAVQSTYNSIQKWGQFKDYRIED